MRRWRELLLTCALVLGVLSGIASPAAANSYSVKDRRDVAKAWALDIVSARVGHKGGGLLHAVTLESVITPLLLRDLGFIDVVVDTDGDFRPERRIYLLGGSRFRAFVTNGSGRELLGRGKVYHPNARTLGAVVSTNVLDQPDGYEWIAAAVTNGSGNCCLDIAPENWYIHDLTAPIADSVSFGDDATTAIEGPTVPVTWHATDTGFAGIAYWTVRHRPEGVEAWTDGEAGRFGFRHRRFDVTRTAHTLPLEQGLNVEVCVALNDWAGNPGWSGLYHVSVPFDDVAPVFSYSPDWDVGADVDLADFSGTRSVTYVDGAVATITVPAGRQRSLVLPGGLDGVATIEVNGVSAGSVDEAAISSDRYRTLLPIVGGAFNPAGGADDVIVVTVVDAGTYGFAIDGYLGAPEYAGGTAFGRCGGRPVLSVADGAFEQESVPLGIRRRPPGSRTTSAPKDWPRAG